MAILTSKAKKRVIYSDISKNLVINPVTKDITRNTNENSVKEAIKNLLFIDKGELPFQPNVGSNIKAMLFEPLTPATAKVLEGLIEETIENYEPRANVIEVVVTGSLDEYYVNVKIVFHVINNEEPQTLEVVLERVR